MSFAKEDFKRSRQEIKGSIDTTKKIMDMDQEEIEDMKDLIKAAEDTKKELQKQKDIVIEKENEIEVN